jgi:hypothetical protein
LESAWNKIITKAAVETIVKDGAHILITAATKTKNFMRPDAVAMTIGKAIKESFLKVDDILEGTKEIIARYDHLATNTGIQSMLTPRIGGVYTRVMVAQSLTTRLCASTNTARVLPSFSTLQANDWSHDH